MLLSHQNAAQPKRPDVKLDSIFLHRESVDALWADSAAPPHHTQVAVFFSGRERRKRERERAIHEAF